MKDIKFVKEDELYVMYTKNDGSFILHENRYMVIKDAVERIMKGETEVSSSDEYISVFAHLDNSTIVADLSLSLADIDLSFKPNVDKGTIVVDVSLSIMEDMTYEVTFTHDKNTEFYLSEYVYVNDTDIIHDKDSTWVIIDGELSVVDLATWVRTLTRVFKEAFPNDKDLYGIDLDKYFSSEETYKYGIFPVEEDNPVVVIDDVCELYVNDIPDILTHITDKKW